MGLTASGDAVWVANNAGRRIVRIDPRTNKVVDSIRLGHFMPCGFLAADRRSSGLQVRSARRRRPDRPRRPESDGQACRAACGRCSRSPSAPLGRRLRDRRPRPHRPAHRAVCARDSTSADGLSGSLSASARSGSTTTQRPRAEDSAAGLTRFGWAQGSPWNRRTSGRSPKRRTTAGGSIGPRHAGPENRPGRSQPHAPPRSSRPASDRRCVRACVCSRRPATSRS